MASSEQRDVVPGEASSSKRPPGRKHQRKTNRKGKPAGSPQAGQQQDLAGEPAQRAPTPIVAIGSSAGGLEALQDFFAKVPPDSGIGFVVVTHVRPGRESMLPDLLSTVTRMKVIHAADSTPVLPNQVIVARDALLRVSGAVVRPLPGDTDPEVTYHPIDQFFRSLAEDQHEHAIGIILSGSGNDGSVGIKAIKAVGGMVMVQAPLSAKYTGMPDSAIGTHLADYILPPKEMPAALVDYCRGPYLQLVRRTEEPALPENAIQSILVRLRAHSGQDFTCYKKSTMSRRIQRRMTVHHINDPQAYLGFLRENPREMDALVEELLISVTSFFRDPEAWKALAGKALPRLLSERREDQQLRVWVPGCATGEEAYTVAILLEEAKLMSERNYMVQIFATDIDERAVEVARAGVYPEGISADVSPERLKAFFTRQDGAYRVNKNMRDTIVFAQQNVISDPPFTKMDLIVCRNVLIYLDIGAQQHVLPNFHYALRPGGLLFLGSAESLGEAGDLFDSVDGKHKVLRRREVAKPVHPVLTGTPTRRVAGVPHQREEGGVKGQLHFVRRVEQLLLERFVPCSVLVDDHGTVLHVQGRSGMFFEPEQGPPRNNVLEMAREGLGPVLAAVMRQARDEKREVGRSSIRVRTNGDYVFVDLTVLPVTEPEGLKGLLLLTLRPTPPPASSTEAHEIEPAAQHEADRLELERELQRTRENLQSTVEELETSNEELKSSNEELQSTNEELQSTNEELETSKEEMQSLNEELSTVNSELQAKMETLSRMNNDMNNLLNSMQVATIFLDTKLRVKRYTEQARQVVRLISSDIGRPLSDLTSSLCYDSVLEDCQQVLASLVPLEKEVQNDAGRWFLVRLMPYRTAENVIEGLVMTIIDIDRTRKGEQALLATEERYRGLVTASSEVLYRMSPDWSEMRQLNSRGFLAQTDKPSRTWLEDYIPTEEQARLSAAIQEATRAKAIFHLEHRVRRQDGSIGWISSRAVPILDGKREIVEWFGAASDISARKQAEEELRQSEKKYRALYESNKKKEGGRE